MGADNPELREQAKKEIEEMTPEERGELITKMQKKVEVFMNLPPEGRASYMQKLQEGDKLEFMKTQILLMSQLQQMQARQGACQHQHQRPVHGMQPPPQAKLDGHESCSSTAPAPHLFPAPPVATPEQQQMM